VSSQRTQPEGSASSVRETEQEAAPSADRDERRPRPRKPRRLLRWVLLGVFAVVLALGLTVADAYYQSYKIYASVKPVIPELERARSFLAEGKVPPGNPLGVAVQTAEKATWAADHARFTFRLTGALPFLGRPVKAARMGAAAAGETAQAAQIIKGMSASLLGDSASGGSGAAPVFKDGTVDVSLLQGIVPSLEQLITHLHAAERDIRAIPSLPFVHSLPGLKAKALKESDQAIALANQAMVGARLLPSFFGANGPKTYFLALQNNSDQRATGGDVLAYAFVTIDKGHMSILSGGGIREIDNPYGFPGAILPPDLTWYLHHVKSPRPFPRIANINFTPNFPVVAQGWSSLIKVSTGRQIDGAFAIDPIAIADLLGQQALHIDAFPRPLNASNLVQMVENQQYRLAKQAQAVVPKELIAASWGLITKPHSVLELVHQLGSVLKEKHFQLWSADPALQAYLTQLGWSGALMAHQTGDYLYEVDNKLRPNKVDFYTHTKITYDVVVQPSGSIGGTCTVQLVNDTPPGQSPPITSSEAGADNNALITVFVPKLARLLASEPGPGDPVAAIPNHTEDDLLVFGRTVDAFPGRPGSVSFSYVVPGVIQATPAGHVYRLTVQHQPMVNPAELTVNVTLPAGSVPKAAAGWTVNGNVATFTTTLTRDFVTSIVF
jgi:hypothetical protein